MHYLTILLSLLLLLLQYPALLTSLNNRTREHMQWQYLLYHIWSPLQCGMKLLVGAGVYSKSLTFFHRNDYFSFFNYHIIEHIIEELGTEEDKTEQEFNQYAK